MYGTNGRRGVSKLAVPVAVIFVLAVAGGYFVLTRTSTPPTGSSASSLPNVPVSTAVDQLISDINARNVDGLVSLYSSNAVDTWTGSTGGLVGKYTPVENIRLLYATTVGKSTAMDANFTDFSQDTLSPTSANATFVMGMLANSTVAGIVTAKVDVSEQWNWGSAGWQITKENWAYTYYDSSFIDAGIPSSTTFPQWGYMLKGGNPNLVSEKSFEWHSGPYLAAALYAFLFGIVIVVAVRFRTRARSASAGRNRQGVGDKRMGPQQRQAYRSAG